MLFDFLLSNHDHNYLISSLFLLTVKPVFLPNLLSLFLNMKNFLLGLMFINKENNKIIPSLNVKTHLLKVTFIHF